MKMLQPIINVLNSQKNILASSSPRRKLILEKNVGLKFDVVPSTFEENLSKDKYQPHQYVLETARHKTEEVAGRLAKAESLPDLIIGADTIVTQGSEIFEKPKDKQDAVRILSQLSGSVHTVLTGVVIFVPQSSTVLKSGQAALDGQFRCTTFVDSTDVYFSTLDPVVIDKYIETGEPFDKAGGYGCQGVGATFVEKIDGDFYNVMGFPLPRFARELSKIYSETVKL